MIEKLRNTLHSRTNERGDVVQTVLTLPIVLLMFFAMINMYSYFNVHSQVESAARNGARLVALYGGESANAIKNDSRVRVNQKVKNAIWDSTKKRCTLGYCQSAGGTTQKEPVVNCTPSIARNAGETVQCTITYHHSAIAPVWSGFEGLNASFGRPMVVSATYVSETGTR